MTRLRSFIRLYRLGRGGGSISHGNTYGPHRLWRLRVAWANSHVKYRTPITPIPSSAGEAT